MSKGALVGVLALPLLDLCEVDRSDRLFVAIGEQQQAVEQVMFQRGSRHGECGREQARLGEQQRGAKVLSQLLGAICELHVLHPDASFGGWVHEIRDVTDEVEHLERHAGKRWMFCTEVFARHPSSMSSVVTWVVESP